jgi:hypothetical protein
MRTKKVLLGRETRVKLFEFCLRDPHRCVLLQSNQVDMDLTEEGPAERVSRQQAVIHLKRDGEFYIRNIGTRAFDVNGKVT